MISINSKLTLEYLFLAHFSQNDHFIEKVDGRLEGPFFKIAKFKDDYFSYFYLLMKNSDQEGETG